MNKFYSKKRMEMVRIKKAVKLMNEIGLNGRAALLFVQTARKFKSHINVQKDGEKADAKNLHKVLSLHAGCGHIIIITAEGPDAEEAVSELVSLVKNRFGEMKKFRM